MPDQSPTNFDAARIWKDRLDTPVGQQVDLPDDLLQMTMSPLAGNDPSEWTLGELLHHACPPIPWLKGVARFGQEAARNGELHADVAATLFHAAIASALVRRNTRIMRVSDDRLSSGMARCLNYPWLDKETRHLIEQAQAHLQGNSPLLPND